MKMLKGMALVALISFGASVLASEWGDSANDIYRDLETLTIRNPYDGAYDTLNEEAIQEILTFNEKIDELRDRFAKLNREYNVKHSGMLGDESDVRLYKDIQALLFQYTPLSPNWREDWYRQALPIRNYVTRLKKALNEVNQNNGRHPRYSSAELLDQIYKAHDAIAQYKDAFLGLNERYGIGNGNVLTDKRDKDLYNELQSLFGEQQGGWQF